MSTSTAVQRKHGLQRVVDVEPGEIRAMLWSCAYFFFVLSAYYVIRPLREEMGAAGGTRNLPWLFTGTLLASIVVHPLFAALVARMPRRRFVPLANRFFVANLVLFFVVLHYITPEQRVWAGRVFFIWTAVFNLFVVSVFWSVMADVFSAPQGKRLFGFIGVGGTLGGILGSSITAVLAPTVGPVNLLLGSIVLLELATRAFNQLAAASRSFADAPRRSQEQETVIGGSTFAGIINALKSPYLLGICLYMLLFTIGSTILYFQQADIANNNFADSGTRTSFFASIDLAVNALTLITQIFLTGRIVKWLGVAVTLTLLPALSIAGFISLGVWPTVAVFVVFQVMRRAGEYAVARPTREVLYTVLSREDKFKAKNFIDTFVYRFGDQLGAWGTAAFTSAGLTMAGFGFAAVPMCVVWLLTGLWLGRQQDAKARAIALSATP